MKDTFISVVTLKAKNSTKTIFAVLVALPGLVQIPTVKSWISAHPKVSATMGTFVMIGTLLHNPKLQQALGIEVPEGATVDATAKVTMKEDA